MSQPARISNAIIFSIFLGAWVEHDEWKKHLMGRAAYLSSQAARFDKYTANMSHPVAKAIGFMIVFGVFFAIYEGLSYLLAAFSKKITLPQSEQSL